MPCSNDSYMMHYKRIVGLLSYLVFLNCADLRGQFLFPGFYVQHFNSQNGLPNTIKGIEQDKDGYVWLATEAGLIRFDGKRFRLYDRSESGEPIARLFDVGISNTGNIYTRVQDKGLHYITASNTLKQISENEFSPNENASLF